MGEAENAVATAADGKAKLDAQAKKFLKNRRILAQILKRFTKEYRSISLEDIESKYIEPKTIMVSKAYIERDFTNQSIEGLSNEDTMLNEGRITYDVIFFVKYPGDDDKRIGMYINCEAQGHFYPGYALETRAFFYAARRFSSQLKAINKNTDYSQLKKVYSIWIVFGDEVPEYAAGTAALYHTVKEDLIGSIEQDERIYDLMSVVMVRFNDKTELDDALMKSLQAIFSNTATKQEKLTGLRNMGVKIDSVVLCQDLKQTPVHHF